MKPSPILSPVFAETRSALMLVQSMVKMSDTTLLQRMKENAIEGSECMRRQLSESKPTARALVTAIGQFSLIMK